MSQKVWSGGFTGLIGIISVVAMVGSLASLANLPNESPLAKIGHYIAVALLVLLGILGIVLAIGQLREQRAQDSVLLSRQRLNKRLRDGLEQLQLIYSTTHGKDDVTKLPWVIALSVQDVAQAEAFKALGFSHLVLETAEAQGFQCPESCAWWGTEESILLDLQLTSKGLYMGSDPAAQRAVVKDWKRTLRWLARRVNISAIVIMVGTRQALATTVPLGDQLRRRAEDVMSQLRAQIPVHLALAHTARLLGCNEFFADVETASPTAGLSWGVTLEGASSPTEALRLGWRQQLAHLRQHRRVRLATADSAKTALLVQLFYEQVVRLEAPLAELVRTLGERGAARSLWQRVVGSGEPLWLRRLYLFNSAAAAAAFNPPLPALLGKWEVPSTAAQRGGESHFLQFLSALSAESPRRGGVLLTATAAYRQIALRALAAALVVALGMLSVSFVHRTERRWFSGVYTGLETLRKASFCAQALPTYTALLHSLSTEELMRCRGTAEPENVAPRATAAWQPDKARTTQLRDGLIRHFDTVCLGEAAKAQLPPEQWRKLYCDEGAAEGSSRRSPLPHERLTAYLNLALPSLEKTAASASGETSRTLQCLVVFASEQSAPNLASVEQSSRKSLSKFEEQGAQVKALQLVLHGTPAYEHTVSLLNHSIPKWFTSSGISNFDKIKPDCLIQHQFQLEHDRRWLCWLKQNQETLWSAKVALTGLGSPCDKSTRRPYAEVTNILKSLLKERTLQRILSTALSGEEASKPADPVGPYKHAALAPLQTFFGGKDGSPGGEYLAALTTLQEKLAEIDANGVPQARSKLAYDLLTSTLRGSGDLHKLDGARSRLIEKMRSEHASVAGTRDAAGWLDELLTEIEVGALTFISSNAAEYIALSASEPDIRAAWDRHDVAAVQPIYDALKQAKEALTTNFTGEMPKYIAQASLLSFHSDPWTTIFDGFELMKTQQAAAAAAAASPPPPPPQVPPASPVGTPSPQAASAADQERATPARITHVELGESCLQAVKAVHFTGMKQEVNCQINGAKLASCDSLTPVPSPSQITFYATSGLQNMIAPVTISCDQRVACPQKGKSQHCFSPVLKPGAWDERKLWCKPTLTFYFDKDPCASPPKPAKTEKQEEKNKGGPVIKPWPTACLLSWKPPKTPAPVKLPDHKADGCGD